MLTSHRDNKRRASRKRLALFAFVIASWVIPGFHSYLVGQRHTVPPTSFYVWAPKTGPNMKEYR